MKIDPKEIALIRERPDDYDDLLKVWYEYMREAEKPEYDELGEWAPDLTSLRPTAADKDADDWLQKRRELFEFLPQWPIEVHECPSEAAAYPKDDDHVTITFFRYFSKAELMDAFSQVLDACKVVGKKGPRTGIYGVAEHQPNDTYKIDALNRRLDAIRAVGVGDEGMLAIGIRTLGLKYFPGRTDNRDSIIRQVYELKHQAKRTIAGVRKGRFPNPDKTRYGDPDQLR